MVTLDLPSLPPGFGFALLPVAAGFAVVMALHPRAGINPRGVYAIWLLFCLGVALYAIWLLLAGRQVPTWMLGFAAGWLFSSLVPNGPRKRR